MQNGAAGSIFLVLVALIETGGYITTIHGVFGVIMVVAMVGSLCV